LIELKSLRLRLGDNLIFNNFNFKAERGEKIGIIGGEGAGKSTLLDVIAEKEIPTSGEVKVNGKVVTLNKNIYTNFSEIRFATMSRSEKFRLMIQKALEDTTNDEKILLLDEPTKNLGTDDVEWLIEVLKNTSDLTVIVASNDRYFLKKICNRTVTLGDSEVDEIILPEVENFDGEDVLTVSKLKKIVDGEAVFKKVSFTVEFGQKIAIVGKNEVAKTKLLKVLGADIDVIGEVKFSPSVKKYYMPRVFSGTSAKAELKKLVESDANFLILDNPTACLDLLTIVELESALKIFEGTIIFTDSDHEFIESIANRIIDLTPNGTVDRISTYDEFLVNETVKEQISYKYKQ